MADIMHAIELNRSVLNNIENILLILQTLTAEEYHGIDIPFNNRAEFGAKVSDITKMRNNRLISSQVLLINGSTEVLKLDEIQHDMINIYFDNFVVKTYEFNNDILTAFLEQILTQLIMFYLPTIQSILTLHKSEIDVYVYLPTSNKFTKSTDSLKQIGNFLINYTDFVDTLKINDTDVALIDHYFLLPKGLHKITVDKNVIVVDLFNKLIMSDIYNYYIYNSTDSSINTFVYQQSDIDLVLMLFKSDNAVCNLLIDGCYYVVNYNYVINAEEKKTYIYLRHFIEPIILVSLRDTSII